MPVIFYISKNLNPTKKKYNTTKTEFLVVVYAINKFIHYITYYKIFVNTNHVAVRYLMNKDVVGGLIIHGYYYYNIDITIVDKPGKDIVVADFLSRMVLQGKDKLVKDTFLHEYLFGISIESPWFANIANYFVTRNIPSHFNFIYKKKILIKESCRFKWIDGMIFTLSLSCVEKICRKLMFLMFLGLVMIDSMEDIIP